MHNATDSVGRIPWVDPLCLARQVIVNYLLGQFRSQTNSEAEYKELTKLDECCVLLAFLNFRVARIQFFSLQVGSWREPVGWFYEQFQKL